MKHPFAVLRSYIRQQSPAFIDLRSGHRIYLSNHPEDIVTFFVVFLKHTYGEIFENQVILDVGANIGCFSIFAALSGAKKVYAFEPSIGSFETLRKNIVSNGLEEVVIPINKAVTNYEGGVVNFPRNSSPYNSLDMPLGQRGEVNEVATVTLDSFMAEQGIHQIDLLKMDCEGEEFCIIPSLPGDMLNRIDKIRMECHRDPSPLLEIFSKHDYAVERLHGNDLWVSKRPRAAAS